MTTMSDPGAAGHQPGYGAPPRTLRRSGSDRIVSGVAGGLGEYFGVDAVIFRVLFAVLAFFGGVGILAYAVAWLLLPEPEVDVSALDRAISHLRRRRVPAWLVIIGGALLLWAAWFSWWVPRPTFPAVVLLVVIALVLVHRFNSRPPTASAPSPNWQPARATRPDGTAVQDTPVTNAPASSAATPPATTSSAATTATSPAATSPAAAVTSRLWPDPEPQPTDPTNPATDTAATYHPEADTAQTDTAQADTQNIFAPDATASDQLGGPDPVDQLGGTAPFGDFEWQQGSTAAPVPPTPLIPPLSDTRRSMQAWLAEAGEAHRVRVQRRRPIKTGVGLALIAGWAFVAILDAFTRVPFPAYLWVGLAILGTGLVLSLLTRRMTLSLLFPMAVLAVLAFALGGTQASLSDGSGRIGSMPINASQLTDQRQFAGQSVLDLSALGKLDTPKSIKITQAAGEVWIKIPAGMNATVISAVHLGDIQNGKSEQTGQHVSGLNIHMESNPPADATGQPLIIHVDLTAGHVQVDRS